MNYKRWIQSASVAALVLLLNGAVDAGSKDPVREPLQVGKPLPNAYLLQDGKPAIRLDALKGRIKIISVVPKLNTPVCDAQTHKLSEENGGLDAQLDIVTISTNTAKDQSRFAEKAHIRNILFLSDAPDYDFGNKTGLLNTSFHFLNRTVLVVDAGNIIRYVDFVPGGGMPDVEKALRAARQVLKKSG